MLNGKVGDLYRVFLNGAELGVGGDIGFFRIVLGQRRRPKLMLQPRPTRENQDAQGNEDDEVFLHFFRGMPA
jgi:hypothetical protein